MRTETFLYNTMRTETFLYNTMRKSFCPNCIFPKYRYVKEDDFYLKKVQSELYISYKTTLVFKVTVRTVYFLCKDISRKTTGI